MVASTPVLFTILTDRNASWFTRSAPNARLECAAFASSIRGSWPSPLITTVCVYDPLISNSKRSSYVSTPLG